MDRNRWRERIRSARSGEDVGAIDEFQRPWQAANSRVSRPTMGCRDQTCRQLIPLSKTRMAVAFVSTFALIRS